MIILLHPDAGPSERSAVRAVLQRLGVTVEETRLGDRTALVAVSGAEHVPAESVRRIPGVDRVIPLAERAPLAMATRRPGAPAAAGATGSGTIGSGTLGSGLIGSGTTMGSGTGAHAGRTVRVGGAAFGGGHVAVIAGPCTVEDPAALRDVAAAVHAAGATALRGGVFKVRTSPHAYQGGGLPALQELAATARALGLPFFTEISDPRQVELVAQHADGLQIGARHMQNFPLLTEAGRTGKPVLLKRHMAADVDEWLLAAEYVLQTGNEQLILCERGLKSSERHVRYLLDIGVIPWLKARIGLPVIVDPSHSAGDWRLVPALARAAIAAGADGLIIEVHPRPETTQCDALQALPPADFARLMDDVRTLARMDGRVVAAAPGAGATITPIAPNGAGPAAVAGDKRRTAVGG